MSPTIHITTTIVVACALHSSGAAPPTLADALAAPTDVWGEAALRERDGPAFEFFAGLLPPLRYVNTDFRHYPIVLSAPFGAVKTRLVSNGSAINARAKQDTWKDAGVPLHFAVGADGAEFGGDPAQLDGPRYADGWLPIVELAYRQGGTAYRQEVFAAGDAVYVGFRDGGGGERVVWAKADVPLQFAGGVWRDADGLAVVQAGEGWQWDAAQQRLRVTLADGAAAHLAVFTKPAAGIEGRLDAEAFARGRTACERDWRALLARGAQIEIPEAVVQNAWRALLAVTLMLANGNAMNYSAGNSYERMFCEESGASLHALHFFGLAPEARWLTPAVLDYSAGGVLSFHDIGFKLQLLARDWQLTRDAEFLRAQRPRWTVLAADIVTKRSAETGLVPREAYCGDIATVVDSLNSNANSWRGLRDFAAALADAGERDEAARLTGIAAEFRRAILAAVEKSERRDVQPPFIPVALFGAEQPYERLTATMHGSYWNLMIQYVLRSGVFFAQPEKARWIARTIEQRGGLCMGMLRFDQHSGLFANTAAVDDLYTLGYVLWLLDQDEPDRALVSFYGKLAQGFTRDTFIGAEGTGLTPLDPHGRPMYLPPNSAAAAFWLWTLRHLLVQDSDTDDDGAPDTLRLCFATPRARARRHAGALTFSAHDPRAVVFRLSEGID